MDGTHEQPEVFATIRDDGSGEVVFGGQVHRLRTFSLVQLRADAVAHIATLAQPLGRAVRVAIDDPDGSFQLLVAPDGSVQETATPRPEPAPAAAATAAPDPTTPPQTPDAPAAAPAETSTSVPDLADQDLAVEERTLRREDLIRAVPPVGTRPAATTDRADEASSPTGPIGLRAPGSQWAPPPVVAVQQAPAPSPALVPDAAAPPMPADPPPAPPVLPRPAAPPSGPPMPPRTELASGSGVTAPEPPPSPPWQPQAAAAPPAGGPPTQEPTAQQPMTRREMRQSFLTVEQHEPPATQGVRGMLGRFGIRTQPSVSERAEREDQRLVSQHWPGVRTIAVVNGKGGAGKTPTTALLAAVFARASGAATLAWDNNETRGTLGWRTEQGPHEATVLQLLPELEHLLSPSARAGDISRFVHHQAGDKYDVLRSNPNLLAADQRITADDVDAVHDTLSKFYKLMFIDSGNDESAGHWLRMVSRADQLVVPTIARPEHAEAGALLLEALASRGGRFEELARNAVVVVSQAREKDVNPSAAEIAKGFEGWVADTVTIPYDPAMVENVLRYDALAPATRRAWLRAAAAVAQRL